jgi:hypothetical protein
LVIKVVAGDGTVLRFNGIGLHLRWPWSSYRALPHSFEGQLRYLALLFVVCASPTPLSPSPKLTHSFSTHHLQHFG